MPHVPQITFHTQNFLDGYGRFLDILFACFRPMGLRFTYLSIANPLLIHKSITLTDFRPNFWDFIQLFKFREFDYFHLFLNRQEKINQSSV